MDDGTGGHKGAEPGKEQPASNGTMEDPVAEEVRILKDEVEELRDKIEGITRILDRLLGDETRQGDPPGGHGS